MWTGKQTTSPTQILPMKRCFRLPMAEKFCCCTRFLPRMLPFWAMSLTAFGQQGIRFKLTEIHAINLKSKRESQKPAVQFYVIAGFFESGNKNAGI